MICLTGDIHHASARAGSQIQVAVRYLGLLDSAGVKVTFFVSGRCFAEEWDDLQPIATHPLVEIGGHNWSCAGPSLLYRIGPARYQRRDVARTMAVVRERTGKKIRCWRNHLSMHGPHTERVLASLGVVICSDGVSEKARGPSWHRAGIYNFPINVVPDNGLESGRTEEWAELVLAQLRRNEAQGVVSNLAIHPVTMDLAGRVAAVQRILAFIASCESVHMREVVARARA